MFFPLLFSKKLKDELNVLRSTRSWRSRHTKNVFSLNFNIAESIVLMVCFTLHKYA